MNIRFRKLDFIFALCLLFLSGSIYLFMPPLYSCKVLLRVPQISGLNAISISDEIAYLSEREIQNQIIKNSDVLTANNFWSYKLRWIRITESVIKIESSGGSKEAISKLLASAIEEQKKFEDSIQSVQDVLKQEKKKDINVPASSDLIQLTPILIEEDPIFPSIKQIVIVNFLLSLLYLFWRSE